MKNLKLILVTSLVLTSMVSVFGQPDHKKETKKCLRNTGSFESLISHKVLGNDYSFSTTTGTYTDLSGSISINNNQLWDDPEYVIPLGFDFDLYDISIDSLYLGIGLGGLVSSKIDSNFEAEYLIMPFETDLIDRGDISGISQSPIGYKVEGTPGNKVLKLEWKNAGFYDEGDSLGTLNDYINFQLWIFEATNDIEFHFGPNMVTDPTINYYGETGAMIGLSDYNLNNAYLLSGAPVNPTLVNTFSFLNGTPLDGTIYKFSKKINTGVESANSTVNDPKIYPNPSNGIFTVELSTVKRSTYQVTDITGKVIQQGILTGRTATIDLSEHLGGVYLLKIDGETTRLVTQ